MRTECIDAYARAPVVEPSGASARGVLAGRPRGGAQPPPTDRPGTPAQPSRWGGEVVTPRRRRCAFLPFSLPLVGLCHKHNIYRYIIL